MFTRALAIEAPGPKSVEAAGSKTAAATWSPGTPAPQQSMEPALLLRPIDSPAATGTRVVKVFTVLMTTAFWALMATTVRWPAVAEGPKTTRRTRPGPADARTE